MSNEVSTPSNNTPPLMTRDEAVSYLIENDPRFAVTEENIRGIPHRVFKNTPVHLRELIQRTKDNYITDGAEKDVLVYQQERWSYDDFCHEIKSIAHALTHQLNVKAGDRVAIAMRNYPELPMLLLAITSIGAIAVPLNAWWTTEELEYAIGDSEAKVVFADKPRYLNIDPIKKALDLTLIAVRDYEGDGEGEIKYRELLNRADGSEWSDVEIDTDQDFAIIYSSGSTGHPKGVALTHRSAIAAVYSWIFARVAGPLMEPPKDKAPLAPSWLIITPLFHVTALQANFLQGLALGAKISLMFKWDANDAVDIVNREQVTRVSGVPTQSAELMEAAVARGETLPSLEGLVSGGAKRPAAQVGQQAAVFPNAQISAGWGMTETNALGLSIIGQVYLDNPESAGRVIPPLQEARIVDDNGIDVKQGDIGELLIKGANTMRCYLNKPEATAESLKDGWLYTGDLARQDEEGLYYIVDRKKSIIIRGGENVSCLEVEGAIHQHPHVAEACVFSIPDERLGEIIGAAIQPKQGKPLEADELATFLKDHLASFKIPERYWFMNEPLPRGATDKIERKVIRANYLEKYM
ncbi:class I adenylate-forming enzyme family protein [Aurantivibrio plasticivorans]